jgi:hypothetical protein
MIVQYKTNCQTDDVIFLNSDSNLSEPSPSLPTQVSEGSWTRRPRNRALGEVFSEAFEIYRNNPVMIVPSLIPFAAIILGLVIFAGFMGLAAFMSDGFIAISAVGGFLLFVIALIVLFILAEGVTIEMVREASLGNKADLSRAWEISKGKMWPLIFSSLLAGILVVLGYALFILPGIILSFAFYFVAQVVMIDGKSGKEALEASYVFLKANLSDAFIIILVSIVIISALHMIPLIGPLLGFLSLPYIYALATLLYLGQEEIPRNKPETNVSIS